MKKKVLRKECLLISEVHYYYNYFVIFYTITFVFIEKVTTENLSYVKKV